MINYTQLCKSSPSLDKILKVEVFVHKDAQLRAAHLILDYTPISSSFQALKCQIKAKDPCLHIINVAAPGFLNPGLGPQGVLTVEPILQCKTEHKATPSQLAVERKRKKKKKKKEK